MRTQSLAKVNSIRGALLGVILLLALMMFFVIGAKPSHAADLTGEYTVPQEFSPGIESIPTNLEETQFELYEVGYFVSGKPYVRLYDKPYAADVILPLDEDQTNNYNWTKKWLECAQTLNNNIMNTKVEDRPKVTLIDVQKDGSFHIEGLSNGLYLLRGDSQIVDDYPPNSGQKSYWWPQPMLISILGSHVEVLVKPMTGMVHHLKVVKAWQWPDGTSEVIQDIAALDSITIELYYGTELKKTVQLPHEGNWYYDWYPASDEADPSMWSVKEIVDPKDKKEFEKNFDVIVSDKFVKDPKNQQSDEEILTITNKYDRHKLVIQKTFEAYVENGEGNSTSLVFELSGYSDDECTEANRVYHKTVGLQFDKSKGAVQPLDVKDIPRNLKHLMVKEVDSGNFEPVDGKKEKEAEWDEETGTYTVSFENKLDNTTHGSGVINKFKINKNKAYEFLKSLGAGK